MLALLLSALMLWSGYIANDWRDKNDTLSEIYRTKIRQQEMVNLAESLESYYRENNTFPASLAALQITGGYEHTRSSMSVWQGYNVSPAIADTVWTFNRMVLFSNDPSKGATVASYLTTNACGVGDANTAESWCGTAASSWFRRETRDQQNEKITTARVRLNRLTQKFANYFNANDKYPDKDYSDVSLGANSITSLAALVNYSGTALNCAGQFQFQGVPIDCADMFDLWGGSVGYQFVDQNHVMFVSETPIFNATGSRVVIAAEMT